MGKTERKSGHTKSINVISWSVKCAIHLHISTGQQQVETFLITQENYLNLKTVKLKGVLSFIENSFLKSLVGFIEACPYCEYYLQGIVFILSK